jgi:L-iditol 2-dehydrogenase/galactitol-1-phosphate 5-dehydrogenase
MKAAVLERERELAYRDVPEPEPFGERPVLVRVGAVGVCGSDLLRYGRGKAYHYPLVLGHEFSAIVEAPPADSRFAPGDRVAVFPLVPDMTDPMSRIGEYAVSTGYDYFGSRRDGAMCERLYAPEGNLVPVPDSLSLAEAAMVEPAAVALHAMLKPALPPRASALVIGAGPIGAFAAQWLRILGASTVYVAEIDERKRALMQELGFEVVDPADVQVDVTIEAAGLPATLIQAIRAAKPFGHVVLLGDLSADATLERDLVSSILRRELTLHGTWNSKIAPAGNSEWEMVVDRLARGDLRAAPLISHTPTLDEVPELFAAMLDRREWFNKVVITVAGS